MTTATKSRARSGADMFANTAPVLPRVRKYTCSVCDASQCTTDPCEHCREDLPGLLTNLRAQQDRIIASIAADTLALDTAIKAANNEELIRYQKLLTAHKAATTPEPRAAFDKRYIASQGLQDGLGAIARAMAALDTRPARENALDGLQRAIAVVELAIEGLKESE